jgi:hypothetical protein
MDLAVCLRFDHLVVLLGDGTGGFVDWDAFDPGDTPAAVVAADFNRDALIDLAVANSGSMKGNVAIFLGDGAGHFKASGQYGNRIRPIYMTMGDFNGDGNIDLVETDGPRNLLTVFLGTGDGGFDGGHGFAAESGPVFVATGDFNRDGRLDVAVTNTVSHSLSVVIGNGDGSFRFPPFDYQTDRGPFSAVVTDFNADRVLDVAIAHFQSENVTVWLGKSQTGPANQEGSGTPPGSA